MSTHPLRHFIVTYGPAGSGKGFVRDRYEHTLRRLYPNTLPEKLKEYKRMMFDGLPRPAHDGPEHRVFVGEIDNYVEHDERYIEQATALTHEYLQWCGLSADCVRDRVNLTDRLVETLGDLYFTTRAVYDARFDDELRQALTNGFHIIFETTGRSQIDWLYEFIARHGRHYDYRLTLVYPVVPGDTIEARIDDRFRKRARCIQDNWANDDWMLKCKGPEVGPPRLPDKRQVIRGVRDAQSRTHFRLRTDSVPDRHRQRFGTQPPPNPGAGAAKGRPPTQSALPPHTLHSRTPDPAHSALRQRPRLHPRLPQPRPQNV